MDDNARNKMSMFNRAKQFAPFDALKGFREALKEKEKIRIDKKQLSYERKLEISYKLQSVAIGTIVTVIYYSDEEYVQLTGKIKKLADKRLCIGELIIEFEDIYDIII